MNITINVTAVGSLGQGLTVIAYCTFLVHLFSSVKV